MGVVRRFVLAHRGSSGFFAGLGVAALVATGVAVAAIPSAAGTITACVAKESGAVRIIDPHAGKHCTGKERRVEWSKGYRYRGAWSSSTTYAALDVVTTQGSSYVAKAASKGKAPANTPAAWGLLAAVGGKGPAGPGAVTVVAYSTTSTTDFRDVDIPGMGLTLRAVCAAGIAAGAYLMDSDASAAYDASGSYDLTTTGSGHGFLVHTGATPGPDLAEGLGLVHYTQDVSSLGAASEFVLDYSSGGGTMTADVAVVRGSNRALVHATLYESASECLVQADATPAT